MSHTVELILDAKADLGEGALWDAKRQVLFWVDVNGHKLHIYDPASKHDRTIDVGQKVWRVVLQRSGGIMLAGEYGLSSLDLEAEQLEIVTDPEDRPPERIFIEGTCDPEGRLWAGTADVAEGKEKVASLYRLDPDLIWHKMLDGVSIPAGITWSPDCTTMYYIDINASAAVHCVDAFDYDLATGEIENRRLAFHIPKEMGWPDGVTIDSQGMLWVPLWGSSKITRWDPVAGQLVQTVDLPVTQPSSCAFGGENLDQLYITTIRTWLNAEQLQKQPLAGGLFRANVGVTGVPAFEFAG